MFLTTVSMRTETELLIVYDSKAFRELHEVRE